MNLYKYFMEHNITLGELYYIFDITEEQAELLLSKEQRKIMLKMDFERQNEINNIILKIDIVLKSLITVKNVNEEYDNISLNCGYCTFSSNEEVYNIIFGEETTEKIYKMIYLSKINLNKNELSKLNRTIRLLSVIKYYLSNDLCNTKILMKQFDLKRRTVQEYLKSPLLNDLLGEEVDEKIMIKKCISQMVGNRKGGNTTANIIIDRPRNITGQYIKI